MLERRRRDWSLNFTVSVRGAFLSTDIILQISTVGMPKMSFEGGAIFQDDPMVNKSEIVVLLGKVWVYAGKNEDFGRRRRKNEFGRKRKRRNIS